MHLGGWGKGGLLEIVVTRAEEGAGIPAELRAGKGRGRGRAVENA